MGTKLADLKRAHNYSEENMEVLITHKNKNSAYCNQYRIDWFDEDGETWLLIRLSGLKRYKRIKKQNIKEEVVLINYNQRGV